MKSILKNNILLILLAAASILLFSIGFIFHIEQLIAISLIIIISSSFSITIKDIPNNIIYILFNLTLIFFISGKVIVDGFSGVSFESFPIEEKYHSLLCIYLSHLALYIGYLFFYKNNPLNNKKKSFSTQNYTIVYKILLIIFIISSVAFLIATIEKILYVYNFGYLMYYTDFKSSLPRLIVYVSNLFYITFFSLAVFPMKNKLKIILYIIFFSCSALTVFTGQRSHVALNLIILLIIIIVQNKQKFKDFLNKKNITILIISICGIFCIFQITNVIRDNKQMSLSDLNPISFIYKQGASSNVIAYEKLVEDQLDNNLYTLAPIKETINNNRFVKMFFHTKSYEGNTYEVVSKQSYLSYDLSYIILGEDYFKGYGLGTSYIAEVYKDFSYIGVFIFGIIISYLCIVFNNFYKFNFFISYILLNSLKYFIFLPRWDTLYFVVVSFQSMNFLLILFLLFLPDERIKKLVKLIFRRELNA